MDHQEPAADEMDSLEEVNAVDPVVGTMVVAVVDHPVVEDSAAAREVPVEEEVFKEAVVASEQIEEEEMESSVLMIVSN